MKRNSHILNQTSDPDPSSNKYLMGSTQKAKMLADEESQQGGADVDELLAVLGYNVRSADMAVVAQKLEQLEEAMAIGNQQEDGQDRLSQIASETVHYNPSDLSAWLETMLSELNPPPNFDSPLQPLDASASASSSFFNLPDSIKIQSCPPPRAHQEHVTKHVLAEEPPFSDYDLKAIPGKSICSQSATENSVNKRVKLEQNQEANVISTESTRPLVKSEQNMESNVISAESTRPLVLVDSQENGVRLVHTLMACAEAVQQNNLTLAEALVRQIGFLTASQPGGAMRKVATYFAEALARRIYGVNPLDNSLREALHMHFYEACPYLKFAHFTANQAILEAFEGKSQVHVVDFSMNQGMQWPALMQALAVRPGGPPVFRLTGIGPPAQDNSDHLQEVGWKLVRFADTIKVKFEYRGFVAESLADLDSSMLNLRPNEETVAVNSVFELHRLLGRPGAIEKVLSEVKQMRPEIVTVVEQESKHNSPVFLDRFAESLHYYSTMFDSLEVSVNGDDKGMAEVYLGKQICNVVACEGVDRVERHERLSQWRTRLGSAGFVPVHLGSNAFKQASMLLALFGDGDGYRVEENNGCLTLGWHTRPLIATSAWQLANRAGLTHRVN